jgi:acyl-CoA thioester hydrolase
MTMLEVFRSGVNTWDCDHMGHMNVRHYFGRANDALACLVAELGLGPTALRERGLMLRARDQHIRFSRELRPGTSYAIHAGCVAEDATLLATYLEVRTLAQEVCATVQTDLVLIDVASGRSVPWPVSQLTAAERLRCEVPEYGRERGVTRYAPQYRPGRAEVSERGLIGAYLGPVRAEHCDAESFMKESAFMGCVADGIGHFFHALQDGPRPQGIGGAALEYRFVFYEWPRADDILEVRSGLKAVGNKTIHMQHCICSVDSGRCVAASEAVAVWFDLTTRKAVPIPAEARRMLEARVIADLTL